MKGISNIIFINRSLSVGLIVSGILFLNNCKSNDGDPGGPATLTVTAVSEVTTTTAKSGGTISNDGGSPIAARGIVWSTSPGPTVALATKTNDGTGYGAFTSNLTGLILGTKYYVRAYASNGSGTVYSNEITFASKFGICKPTMITRGTLKYEFEYDSKLRLRKRKISLSTSPNFVDSLVYSYGTGKITVKEYDSDDGLYLNQEHTLNVQGYSSSYLQTLMDPGTYSLEYFNDDYIKSLKIGGTFYYRFSYQDGNLLELDNTSLGSNKYTFEYHTDKQNTLSLGYGSDIDIYNVNFMVNHNPLWGKANKNLLKKVTITPPNPAATTEYLYEFDDNGYVKKVNLTTKNSAGTITASASISIANTCF